MKIDNLCVNNLRTLAMDQINIANSGHPGIALSAAPILYSLYHNIMHVNPLDPKNIFRDRFVMSAGHGSSILYATLYACGFNFSVNDLKSFRQLNSRCAGHPECEPDNGVDASTGPLGQGVANAVGMAIAEAHMAKIFNKPDIELFDNFTYVLTGDGCLMEGVANEALSLAGTLKLNKLILLYDFNKVTIDGKLDIANKQNTKQVLMGYGFNVFEIKNGNSVEEITKAIKKAQKSNKPSVIMVNTIIGYGSVLAGNSKVHGKPLGFEDTKKLKEHLNINVGEFEILEEVENHFQIAKNKYKIIAKMWEDKLEIYKNLYPAEYKKLQEFLKSDYKNCDKILSKLEPKEISSRDAGGEILNAIANSYENIIGGCADVCASTKAEIKNSGQFLKGFENRNIMFGIREFAMAAICNGISLYGGLTPFASTFLVFSDYMKNAMRMSAMQNLKVLYILTHDSIYVGEDGPTHQPIEQLAMLRSTPNIYVFRPCDYIETMACYSVALNIYSPSVLALTRQKLPLCGADFEKAKRGGYVINKENGKLQLNIIATGSEVKLAIDVKNILEKQKIYARVISVPCFKRFMENEINYIENVIPKNIPTICIEASSDTCFNGFIGRNGILFGINTFGKSGKAEDVVRCFKFDVENITKSVLKMLKR